MLKPSALLLRPTLLGMALSACLATPLALAAGSASDNSPQTRYQDDVALCNSSQSYQDKATCLKEAGAALAEAKRHRLTSGEQPLPENRTKRCEALSGQDRDDCMLQMSNQNTVVTGSVESGGILRETTITIKEPGMAPALQ